MAAALVGLPLNLVAVEGDSATATATVADSTAAEELESTLAQWRDTLRFGIDSEILELVGQLGVNGETSLNDELVELAGVSLNPEVIDAVVRMYRALEDPGVVEIGLRVVKQAVADIAAGAASANAREHALLTSSIYYLGEVGGAEVADALEPLIDHEDTLVATAAIAAVGASGDESFALALIERLDDLQFAADLKPQLLLALGALHATSAVERLESVVADNAKPRVWRMYASDALGKIGAGSSVDVLRAVLSEDDPLVKSYAAAALGGYELDTAKEALVAGLRDSHWSVRVAAAAGLGRESASSAIAILSYKADRDPSPKVRFVAIEALAQIHHPQARKFVMERVQDTDHALAIREGALRSLIKYDLAASTDFIKQIMDAEWSSSPPTLLLAAAQELSGIEQPRLKPFYELFLGSPHPAVRVYGLRGVVSSGLRGMRPTIEQLKTDDTVAAVRLEAELALEKL